MADHQEPANPIGLRAGPLRIVCVLDGYAPHVSGSEVYAQGVCEELARRGHDVRVICAASGGAPFSGEDEVRRGVRVWRGIGARRSPYAALRSRVERRRSAPERALTRPRALEYEARLREADPDVVLALPVPRQSVVGAARFARSTRRPALVAPFYHIAFDRFVDDATNWLKLLGSFTAVLASTAVEESYLESRGIAPARLRRPGMFVRPLASPTLEAVRVLRQRLGVGEGFLVVSAATQFSEPKGTLLLARASAALPQLTFALIGGTRSSRAWLARSAPLGRNVHILGFVSEREKAVALAAADLFALPSRADSFGIAYQEAHSLGTPSLALDLPVMREVIGPAGFYVDPDEGAKGITRAIAELSLRPDRLKRAAAEAPLVAARYAPEHVLGRICGIVEEVVARHRSSPVTRKRLRRWR